MQTTAETDGRSAAALNLILGIWLFISHWVLSYTGADPTWNDIVFGILVAVVAAVRMTGFPIARFASAINIAIGAWLVIAGLTIADSGAAVANNIIVGAVVFILAAIGVAPALERRSHGGPQAHVH
jgi:hypothetical protein